VLELNLVQKGIFIFWNLCILNLYGQVDKTSNCICGVCFLKNIVKMQHKLRTVKFVQFIRIRAIKKLKRSVSIIVLLYVLLCY